jgi:flagellar hook-length control protein FliK
MLSQNLIQLVSDEDGQVIDNKELMAMVGEFDGDMQSIAEDTLPAQWMQFLKSHFTEQTDFSQAAESAASVKLVVKDIHQDADEGAESAIEIDAEKDPVAAVVVIPGSIAKGETLPPGRQSSSARVPLSSAVINPAVEQAVNKTESIADDAGKSDIDPKSLQSPEIAKKELQAKNSAEVVNIRQQVTATDTVTIKTVENSVNPMQPGVTTQISHTPNAATQVLPPHLQTLSVSTSANNQQWGDALGERVSFLINQKLNNAEIRIDPPPLGKLDIKIHLNDDSAQVVIHTQHAQTRDLVDSSSFRLREILQEAGYSNVDVNVSHRDSSSNQNASGDNQEGGTNSEQSIAGDSPDTSMAVMQQASITVANGRIDYFA